MTPHVASEIFSAEFHIYRNALRQPCAHIGSIRAAARKLARRKRWPSERSLSVSRSFSKRYLSGWGKGKLEGTVQELRSLRSKR